MRGAVIAAALLAASPAQSAEIKTGLELLVACSPTETSPQATFDDCINTIINRVSELSARGIGCPSISTKEQLLFWIVSGRKIVIGYWKSVSQPAAASTISPNDAIDAPLRFIGFGRCIDAKEM